MKINFFNIIIKSIDLIIFFLVMAYLINDFMSCFVSCINTFYDYFNLDSISSLVSNVNSTEGSAVSTYVVQESSHTTQVRFIHDDGNWSNGIRSLFIYGTGALRLHLIRGGTPASRTLIIASTLATDAVTKVIANTINDPAFVKSHFTNWIAIWQNGHDAKVKVDAETSSKITEALEKKYLPDSSDIENITNKILSYILDNIRHILEPVTSNYSNEVLAGQIHDISILLFILSILITILIICLLINILVLINSDRIIKLFTNKYIRWYVNVNLKLIGIEVFCLGSSIIYFMYCLSKGLQYLATHPIIFS